ncbi:MAG: C25 family cysteine peptidase [Candidatus Pacearchaeota archaeon]|jgi:hypothetical protein
MAFDLKKVNNIFALIIMLLIIAIIILILIIVRAFIFENDRDFSKYTEKQVFLISDKDWKAVMGLVPVSTWTDSSVYKYPTLIFHEENPGFDADSIIHFLQKYSPDRVIVVGAIPLELTNLLTSPLTLGAGLNPAQIQSITTGDYLSYWDAIKDIVYVEDKYELALLASTYASLINAPLIIKGEHDTGFVFTGRRVTCVGDVDPEYGTCSHTYDLEGLQEKYIQETNTDKIIFVNVNDSETEIIENFQPEKSADQINQTFLALSMASPILASARHEVILGMNLSGIECGPYSGVSNNDFVEADSFIENKISDLFDETPGYLTIVASPKGISYWHDCGNSGNGSADWLYGSIDDDEPDLKVGRIYSITLSGTSSYIARVLFYDDLIDNIYNEEGNYTGMSIAAPNFGQDQINSQTIKTNTSASGYDSICFTWNGAASQPECDVYTNIQDEDYQGKQFISFADHGSPTSWAGTIVSLDIPWLDLPYTLSLACQTNNFWSGLEETFGPTWIRRGGISYHASIPSTNGYNWEMWAIQELTGVSRLDLGTMATNLINRADYNYEVRRQYTLLGDPTFVPKAREVTWA